MAKLLTNLLVVDPKPEAVIAHDIPIGGFFILEAAHDVVFQRVEVEMVVQPDVVRFLPYYSENTGYRMGVVSAIGGHVRVLPVQHAEKPLFKFPAQS